MITPDQIKVGMRVHYIPSYTDVPDEQVYKVLCHYSYPSNTPGEPRVHTLEIGLRGRILFEQVPLDRIVPVPGGVPMTTITMSDIVVGNDVVRLQKPATITFYEEPEGYRLVEAEWEQLGVSEYGVDMGVALSNLFLTVLSDIEDLTPEGVSLAPDAVELVRRLKSLVYLPVEHNFPLLREENR